MIPIDSPPLPRYRAIYWDGSYIQDFGGLDRFTELLDAEALALNASKLYPNTVVEVWDVLLVCPMAWFQAGKLGWHR